jgi:pyruvate/2-oxoglutarate dehydrogenase complex dihydrolipoamide dehydrogenase (E3) component
VECVSTRAVFLQRRCCATLRCLHRHHHATAFGISGDVSFDFSRVVSRSREVAEARVRGAHFLMRKNNLTEIDGHGRFTGPTASTSTCMRQAQGC